MRSIKVAFTALALSATTAFAAATTPAQTVTLTNSIADTIAVSGTTVVSITAVRTPTAPTSGTPQLAYSTNADHSATTYILKTRKVMVSSTALPTNLTGTVAFTPTGGNGSAVALPVELGSTTAAPLVTAIPEYITQDAADLTYSFTASKGFISGSVDITYTLADE